MATTIHSCIIFLVYMFVLICIIFLCPRGSNLRLLVFFWIFFHRIMYSFRTISITKGEWQYYLMDIINRWTLTSESRSNWNCFRKSASKLPTPCKEFSQFHYYIPLPRPYTHCIQSPSRPMNRWAFSVCNKII